MTQKPARDFHLHLISDSTGGTLHNVARACVAQFEGVEPIEHFWNMIRNEKRLESVYRGLLENPGIVLFTIVDEHLRKKLKNFCRFHNIPAIPVLEPVLNSFASFLGQPSLSQPGRQHRLDKAYFERIDAMDFVLQNDDGQISQNLEEADVILVGVSRTSKTPTCVYLGNRGIKAANIPFVPGVTDLDALKAIKGPLIVALTESPKRLIEVRRNRLDDLNQRDDTSYTNEEIVEDEVRQARRFYAQMKWPVIDVTKRSVEETATEIMKIYAKKHSADTQKFRAKWEQ